MSSGIPKLVLLAASLGFALSVLEVAVRIASRFDRERNHRLFTQPDPQLGWVKVPDQVNRHRTAEYDVSESINSRGVRGPEVSLRKPEGEFRILVIGDSFAEGYTVAFEDLCTEVLERRLTATTSTRVEVINGGTGGYSTDQELLYFRRDGTSYEPDWTILLFYYNDVWYNDRSHYKGRYAKPRFVWRESGLELVTAAASPPPRPERRSGLRGWLAHHSKLYPLVRERVKNLPGVRRRLARSGWLAGERPGPEWVFARRLHPELQRAWRVTEALLVDLQRTASEHGSELLVFFVPSEYRIYPERWRALREARLWSDRDWSPAQPAVALAEICDRHQIDCIDPSERFRGRAEALAPKQFLYFPEDGHWNAEGHRLAGELLAERVLDRIPRAPSGR